MFLPRHPDVWAKTVFILNYDENDGFFDHIPAPVPALGPRVPALIISPWTKGGWINSQLFDHTSVLRFIEARFNVPVPHLTPWRKAVCGDLTSAFAFDRADPAWTAKLPHTESYLAETRLSCKLPPPRLPERQILPVKESGQRSARPLPYALQADFEATLHGPSHILLHNSGAHATVLQIAQEGVSMRHVTLDIQESSRVPQDEKSHHSLCIHGPDGFYRAFAPACPVSAALRLDPERNSVKLVLQNGSGTQKNLALSSAYSPETVRHITLQTAERREISYDLTPTDNWYDLLVADSTLPHEKLHFAGHLQTGYPSRTDPLIGKPASL
ncbi:alkaline phosphatase family protein [Gluconobacter cerinus]|uniref:alkaline phosphatase family protein n=1 Tax=Gluconobacter cerinus TaxID=38307 RepID=UPI0039ED3676